MGGICCSDGGANRFFLSELVPKSADENVELWISSVNDDMLRQSDRNVPAVNGTLFTVNGGKSLERGRDCKDTSSGYC